MAHIIFMLAGTKRMAMEIMYKSFCRKTLIFYKSLFSSPIFVRLVKGKAVNP